MKLKTAELKNNIWQDKGYSLPKYNIGDVVEATKEKPTWIHFGAGNIFRAYAAALMQKLIESNDAKTGIIVCDVYDEEIIEKAYRAYDNLSLAVTLKANGDIKKDIIASVVESVMPHSEIQRMSEIFEAPSLQMVTLTITEKGYAVKNVDGEYPEWIKLELEDMNRSNLSTIAMLTKLLYIRYLAGAMPIALVSMDNCSHNGTLLKNAVLTFAEHWTKKGMAEKAFLDYVNDESKVSFPWSMIDKITPRPSDSVVNILKADGFEDTELVQTSKGTYVACFVNAEESEYLAVEDRFPNGRPPLEKVGVLFSDRDTIDRIEMMKVSTCLNPLHTVLAVYGCLMGYQSIADEMRNPLLKRFIEKVGYDEGMPVVVDPKIIKAEDFIDEVINLRFPNPFIPDTPQRIATDTSKKIPIRFGETLKAYINKSREDLSFLTYIPLFFAGWLRYLMGVDDEGKAFEISPDPNLEMVQAYVEGITLSKEIPEMDKIKQLLSNETIFGINLYKYNLGEKTEKMFRQMVSGKGAVKATLEKYLG